MTPPALQYLQIAVGLCLAAYALFLIAQRFFRAGWRVPQWFSNPGHVMWEAPVDIAEDDDLRILIGMAARFRDAGNQEAVRACQDLIDQLLNPKAPVETPRAPTP